MTTAELVPLVVTGLVLGAGVVFFLRRKPPSAPAPTPDARPGHYVVRWEHIDYGSRQVYAGPDLKRARWDYYHAEGIKRGATVEFWDGPHRRGVRTA